MLHFDIYLHLIYNMLLLPFQAANTLWFAVISRRFAPCLLAVQFTIENGQTVNMFAPLCQFLSS